VLIRAAMKLAEHLEPSKAVRDELKEVNQILSKKQADKSPNLYKELGHG